MNPDKKIIVDQLVQRLENTPYLLLVDYTGLTMPQFNTIRKRLREVSAKFHVTKVRRIARAQERYYADPQWGRFVHRRYEPINGSVSLLKR